MIRVTNTLTGLVALLVLAIGGAAFVLSYDALRAVALAGGIPPALTWLWPLLIDAPLVVFTVALLVAQLTRQNVALWAGLVILYTVGTIAFNLVHAQPGPLGWAVATVAPLGLLLTTEALRHLSKGIIERSHAIQGLAEIVQAIDQRRADLAELLSTKQGELDKLGGQIERAQKRLEDIKAETNREISANVQELNAARAAKVEERRANVLGLLSDGMTPGQIAGELGVTVKTIRRDIVALNGRAIEVMQ